jgi:hypothetical protein
MQVSIIHLKCSFDYITEVFVDDIFAYENQTQTPGVSCNREKNELLFMFSR